MKRGSVVVSETARDFLRRTHPTPKKAIRKALDSLREDPFQGKPLTAELAGLWSLRVSRHRVIYRAETGKITVVHIGPRKDVYETLRELLAK